MAPWGILGSGVRRVALLAVIVGLASTFCSPANDAFEINGQAFAPPTHDERVADALRSAGVAIRPGMVRGILSGKPLQPNGNPPLIELDGKPVLPDARVNGHGKLTAADGTDTLEAVVPTDVAGPLPGGAPDLETTLWWPGQPRVDRSWVGQVSGEVVASMPLQEEVAARAATGKVVALSFDDGPHRTFTPQILKILAEEDVPATFCVVGTEIRANPDLVKAEVDAGHTLCNHTVNHPDLSKRARDFVASQLTTTTELIKGIQGSAPTVFRAPYGSVSPTVTQVAHAQGMRVWGWSVDSIDYRRPAADTLVKRVTGAVQPGSVILMHDGGGDRSTTVAALRPIIKALKAQGYTFSTPTQIG